MRLNIYSYLINLQAVGFFLVTSVLLSSCRLSVFFIRELGCEDPIVINFISTYGFISLYIFSFTTFIFFKDFISARIMCLYLFIFLVIVNLGFALTPSIEISSIRLMITVVCSIGLYRYIFILNIKNRAFDIIIFIIPILTATYIYFFV